MWWQLLVQPTRKQEAQMNPQSIVTQFYGLTKKLELYFKMGQRDLHATVTRNMDEKYCGILLEFSHKI